MYRRVSPQTQMLTMQALDAAIPEDHVLRKIRALVGEALFLGLPPIPGISLNTSE